MNFKINSRPLFTIISKLKNDNFKTRDFSPLIERVPAGVVGSGERAIPTIYPTHKFWQIDINHILIRGGAEYSHHILIAPPPPGCSDCPIGLGS